jgi:NAD(P)H-flavin reductase
MINPHIPWPTEVVERVEESASVYTLRLRIRDKGIRKSYRFTPGQFNMIYLFGVGEVAISIVSDPGDHELLDHTIRAVGRVTNGLAKLRPGDTIGLRGPYGRGWPLDRAEGKDVLAITGGLGCAPSVSVINYIMERREEFGRLTIMQGVKHHDDLLWRERYALWDKQPGTRVLLAADVGGPLWPWHVGPVTVLFDEADIDPHCTIVIMCGPEGMMRASIENLLTRGINEQCIWLSMERNMQCALRQCGHCQFGAKFVCSDGPVFSYPEIKPLFGISGF